MIQDTVDNDQQAQEDQDKAFQGGTFLGQVSRRQFSPNDCRDDL